MCPLLSVPRSPRSLWFGTSCGSGPVQARGAMQLHEMGTDLPWAAAQRCACALTCPGSSSASRAKSGCHVQQPPSHPGPPSGLSRPHPALTGAGEKAVPRPGTSQRGPGGDKVLVPGSRIAALCPCPAPGHPADAALAQAGGEWGASQPGPSMADGLVCSPPTWERRGCISCGWKPLLNGWVDSSPWGRSWFWDEQPKMHHGEGLSMEREVIMTPCSRHCHDSANVETSKRCRHRAWETAGCGDEARDALAPQAARGVGERG